MFDGIIKFFESIGNIISTIVTSLVDFFEIAANAVQYVLSLAAHMPAFMIPIFGSLLIILIVKLIVGR